MADILTPGFLGPSLSAFPATQKDHGPVVQQISQPSDSEHQRFVFPTQSLPPSSDDGPRASNASATRRSRRQESLAKLPAFEFKPGDPLDAVAPSTTSTESPMPSPPATPRSTRHRRTDSELLGVETTLPPIPIIPTSEMQGPKFGHRHRRSGAVSQDIGFARPRTSLEQLSSINSRSRAGSTFDESHQDGFRASRQNQVQFDEPNVSSRHSSPGRSSHNADVHLGSDDPARRTARRTHLEPTGYVASSLRSRSSESSKRKSRITEPTSHHPILPKRPASSPLLSHSEQLPEHSSLNVSKRSKDKDEPFDDVHSATFLTPTALSAFEASDLGLSDNFDDDPTASIVSTAPQSPSILIGPPSPYLDFPAGTDNIIDLDDAIEDGQGHELKSLKGKSFSAARKSMHSGQPSGTHFGSGMFSHRRTESAPQLVPTSFTRPEIHRFATTASEKGFTMEDVFEEDEEEIRSKRSSICRIATIDRPFDALGIGLNMNREHNEDERSTPTLSTADRFEMDSHCQDTSTHETPRASRLHTPTFDRMLPQDRVTVVDFDNASTSGTPSHSASLEAMKSQNAPPLMPLSHLRTSPMNSGFFTESSLSTPVDADRPMNSTSTFSTPRLDTAASSFDGRKVSAATSTLESDDGSQHVASRHGRPGSTALRYLPRRRSPMSATTNRQSVSATSFASHSDDKSSKRASIASLSQLLGRSFGDKNRSSSVLQPDTRCKTSDGLGVGQVAMEQQQIKQKKKKRLSRMFKFWKAGEASSSSGE